MCIIKISCDRTTSHNVLKYIHFVHSFLFFEKKWASNVHAQTCEPYFQDMLLLHFHRHVKIHEAIDCVNFIFTTENMRINKAKQIIVHSFSCDFIFHRKCISHNEEKSQLSLDMLAAQILSFLAI